jgi:hypothetical protein
MIQIFEGTCDVCGALMRMEFDPSLSIVDTWVESDGTWGTWRRHIENREANPNCDKYSSRITFIGKREE